MRDVGDEDTGIPRLRIVFPMAGELVCHGEADHDAEPEKCADNDDARESRVVLHMHEEQYDEKHFGDSDGESDDGVPTAEINVGYGGSERGADHQSNEDANINAYRDDVLVRRLHLRIVMTAAH